jgi:hypothetical protein
MAAQSAALASSLTRDSVLSGYAKLLHSNNASGGGLAAGGLQAKRRPTSAAGMGIRAYINANAKTWRE